MLRHLNSIEKVERIKGWVCALKTVYSLVSIYHYVYKIQLKELKNALTEKEQEEIICKFEDILYVFEIAYEGDYAGVAEYYDSLSEKNKLLVSEYSIYLYEGIPNAPLTSLQNRFTKTFNRVYQPAEYASIH